MIVALIGTPSPLTYIATNVLRALVQVVSGEHHVVGANTVPDLRSAWPAKEGRMPAVVLASDMPNPDLVQFLVQSKAPLIVNYESLDVISRFMRESRGLDPITALRIGTRSLSGLEALALNPPPTAFRLHASSTPLRRVVEDLLRACNDQAEATTISNVLTFLGGVGYEDRPFFEFIAKNKAELFPIPTFEETINQELIDASSELSQGYSNFIDGRPLDEVFWPGLMFLRANTPGLQLEGAVELEGPARFLIHGPYFHLPPGLWEAEVIIEVRDSYSDNKIGFDVYSTQILAACNATLPENGAFACDMIFRVSDLTTPVEIRTYLVSGAIEGKIQFHGVRLKRRTQ